MELKITKEWFEKHAAAEDGLAISAGMHSCNCIGPRRGEPLCPCMMRGVTVEDGRYVQKHDLGPVKDAPLRERMIKAASASLRTLRDR